MKIALFARGRWAFLLTASLLFALLTAAPASALATDWRRLCESGTPSEVQEALRTSSADELLPGGSRPLHVAAEYARNPEVVRLLLKHGASLTSVGLEGLTPLMLAAAYNPNPVVTEAFALLIITRPANSGFSASSTLSSTATSCTPPTRTELNLEKSISCVIARNSG